MWTGLVVSMRECPDLESLICDGYVLCNYSVQACWFSQMEILHVFLLFLVRYALTKSSTPHRSC
jgi:hypothetical protein